MDRGGSVVIPTIIEDRRSPMGGVMTRAACAGGVLSAQPCLVEDAPQSVTGMRRMTHSVAME